MEYNLNNAQVSVIFSALSTAQQIGAFLSQYTVALPIRPVLLTSAGISVIGAAFASKSGNIYLLVWVASGTNWLEKKKRNRKKKKKK